MDVQEVKNSSLVKEAFHFWFHDNKHIRSPFPDYIKHQLEIDATERFAHWLNNLHDKAENEVNDDIISEKFEEIVFETALSMVKTEDERITILYPFLPRLGDVLEGDTQEEERSTVIKRYTYKEKDNSFLHITLQKNKSKEMWNTKFELPV